MLQITGISTCRTMRLFRIESIRIYIVLLTEVIAKTRTQK